METTVLQNSMIKKIIPKSISTALKTPEGMSALPFLVTAIPAIGYAIFKGTSRAYSAKAGAELAHLHYHGSLDKADYSLSLLHYVFKTFADIWYIPAVGLALSFVLFFFTRLSKT